MFSVQKLTNRPLIFAALFGIRSKTIAKKKYKRKRNKIATQMQETTAKHMEKRSISKKKSQSTFASLIFLIYLWFKFSIQ